MPSAVHSAATLVAALVMSQHPEYTAEQVVQRIVSTTKPLASLTNKTITGGMVDAYNALTSGVSIAAGSTSGTGSFGADANYSGGNTDPNSNTIDTSGVANPPPVDVFHNERWSGSSFTYNIPSLQANASYDVQLYFAETYFSTAGSREFNVSINNSPYLTNYDIIAAAGGANKATSARFDHVAADGSGHIAITFTNVSGGAKVNGIQVAPSKTTAVSVATGANGFVGDSGYLVGDAGNTDSTGNSIDTSNVVNPAPASVYQNERWTSGTLTYKFQGLTAYASYFVRLDFAETFFSAANQRKFNVSINSNQVLTNFDIYAASGGQFRAVSRQFNAKADGSGAITIAFTNVSGGAKVNGIQVTPASGATGSAQVDLAGFYNAVGITSDSNTSPGNLDGGNNSFSSTFVGPLALVNGVTFNLGPAGVSDVVKTTGQSVTLPTGQFSSLRLLATGLNGSQTGSFTIYYTDGSSASIGQTFSDWHNGPGASGESLASYSPYRNSSTGRDNNVSNFYLYSYSLAIDPAKTVSRVVLPGNSNIAIFAMNLIP